MWMVIRLIFALTALPVYVGANEFSDPLGNSSWPRTEVPTSLQEVHAYGLKIGLRTTFDHCLQTAESSTPHMYECISEERSYQESRLTKVSKRIKETCLPNQCEALLHEEESWKGFLNAYCRTGKNPGQGQVLDHEECLLNQTADRATELELKAAK